MKKTSPCATLVRNAVITGNNSKSYNDKHPENPWPLTPIKSMLRNPSKHLIKQLQKLGPKRIVKILHTLPKPTLVATYTANKFNYPELSN